jgi:hypothetical protein
MMMVFVVQKRAQDKNNQMTIYNEIYLTEQLCNILFGLGHIREVLGGISNGDSSLKWGPDSHIDSLAMIAKDSLPEGGEEFVSIVTEMMQTCIGINQNITYMQLADKDEFYNQADPWKSGKEYQPRQFPIDTDNLKTLKKIFMSNEVLFHTVKLS